MVLEKVFKNKAWPGVVVVIVRGAPGRAGLVVKRCERTGAGHGRHFSGRALLLDPVAMKAAATAFVEVGLPLHRGAAAAQGRLEGPQHHGHLGYVESHTAELL